MMTATFWIPFIVVLFAVFATFGVAIDVRGRKVRWRWALIALMGTFLFALNLLTFYVTAKQHEKAVQWHRDHPSSRRVFE